MLLAKSKVHSQSQGAAAQADLSITVTLWTLAPPLILNLVSSPSTSLAITLVSLVTCFWLAPTADSGVLACTFNELRHLLITLWEARPWRLLPPQPKTGV